MQPKKSKQEAAKVRQAQYDSLSNKDKLNRLDQRLGKGIGAKKQRAKLAK